MQFKIPTKVILIVAFFLFSVSQAQEKPTEPVVTAKFLNKSRIGILETLEEKFQVYIYFKEEWFDSDPINIAFDSKLLSDAIEQLLEGFNLDLYVYQNNYVVLPRKEVALITGTMLDQSYSEDITDYGNMKIVGEFNQKGKINSVKLSGKIVDGADNETLIGATIVVNNSNLYTISGRDGKYKLEMKPGIYNLIVSCVGFENTYVTVQLLGEGNLNIELFEKTHVIDEIKIYSQKADRNISSSQMSLVQMDGLTIKRLPSIIGEKDILKSLTLIPGIKSVGEFGTGINVRGGGEDQNLFLLEGASLYNTSHIMGLVSVVNPDMVSSVSLHKGHISSEYGERVSSVMEIDLRDYKLDKKITAAGGVGIYNSRLSLKGSLFDQKFTYKIGGRLSYSDYLLTRIQDYYLMNSSAKFYDLNALFDINLKKDHITISTYWSYDYFKYAKLYNFNYGNRIASLNWMHRFSESFSTNLTLAYSNYNIERKDYTDSLSLIKVSSELYSTSAKLRFTLTSLTNNRIDFGVQTINYNIMPGKQGSLIDPQQDILTLDTENGLESAVFVNDQWTLSKKISMQLGLRFSYFINYGPGKVYNYDVDQSISWENVNDSTNYGAGEPIKTYSRLEPRFLIKYQIASDKSIKFSYNANSQYIARVSYSSISSPEDIWKLSDTYLKPMYVHQVTLGYFQNFFNNQLESSLELYYKDIQNIIDFKNGAILQMNKHLETELLLTRGYNYGLEFLLKKNYGRLDGWISYTYSRAFQKTSGNEDQDMINRNEIYPSRYDKPHDITLYLNYNVNRRVRLGMNFKFCSGRAVTLPEYVYQQYGNEIVFYSDRNKYRLPAYHRLDLFISVSESLRLKKKWKGSWTFSILNVYARKNAYSVFYKREAPSKQNNYELFSMYKLYLIGKPMPVLTYNFIF